VDPVDNADATDRVDTRAGTAYDVTCPAREVLELIASKWTVLVVDALADGPERYSALRRVITGVSQKMLTQTLRELERDGIIIRTVYDTKPPSVDYRLSEMGASLTEPIAAIRRWADTHFPEITQARQANTPESAQLSVRADRSGRAPLE
jgi:DNA-binding HxlR family transcriptional regulator